MPRSDRPLGAPIHDNDEPQSDPWGSMFRPVRPGSWAIESKSDPRWNDSGRGMVGGFLRPPEVDAAIARKKKELRVKPPADLEWSYMKD